MTESPAAEQKPRILIVDDRPENLQVLLQTLKQEYAVIAATSGEKALELARKFPPPDLILLDVMMPGLDGYGVCQRLKADPRTQNIPVIFVSALEDEADETKGFELGAVDYITKPISPLVVKARLKSHLTLQRLNQELWQMNQQLAKVTRHKDEFLANMSHELRTPLNTILGFTEALQEGVFGELNDRQWNALASVDSSGQHLLALINDILDLSKIVAGKESLQPTPTAIAELCRASLLFVQNQAQQKHIQLEMAIADDVDLVLLDERRIKQALINLLSNGVKFTPNGGQVSLRVHRHFATDSETGTAHPLLIFQVQDSGIGISEADQALLFQPFVQIDSPLHRQQTGTGLGLALVRQIAELHGGQVRVESQVGQGSCFTLALPLIAGCGQKAEPSTQSPGPTLWPQAESVLGGTKPLVLVVAGSPDHRQTLATYLAARHYRVMTAQEEAEAIALVQSHVPQVILLDMQLREREGFAVTHRLRQVPHCARIPIIGITAPGTHPIPCQGPETGLDDCLHKPFRLKELTYTINRLLSPLSLSDSA